MSPNKPTQATEKVSSPVTEQALQGELSSLSRKFQSVVNEIPSTSGTLRTTITNIQRSLEEINSSYYQKKDVTGSVQAMKKLVEYLSPLTTNFNKLFQDVQPEVNRSLLEGFQKAQQCFTSIGEHVKKGTSPVGKDTTIPGVVQKLTSNFTTIISSLKTQSRPH